MAIELEYTNSLTLASLFTPVCFDVLLLGILVWLDVNAIELITSMITPVMPDHASGLAMAQLTPECTITSITLNPNHDVLSLSKQVDPCPQKTHTSFMLIPQQTLVLNGAVTMLSCVFCGKNRPLAISPWKRVS